MISPATTIGFIGAGNMAGALIEGLLSNGINAACLHASDTSSDKLATLAAKGVQTTIDNSAVIRACDVVILAVKPQMMASVLAPLQDALLAKPCLLISVAAGIQMHSLQQWTHQAQPVVRRMPNTPALVLAGASGLYANTLVSAQQKQLATDILEAVGLVCWLDAEAQLDAVTALSGSGPAYFFLLMEAMQAAAIRLGLPAEVAKSLCLQTAFGAATLALASDVEVAELRRRVTSPGGTTEAALLQFEADGFGAMVDRALDKAARRSEALGAPATKTK